MLLRWPHAHLQWALVKEVQYQVPVAQVTDQQSVAANGFDALDGSGLIAQPGNRRIFVHHRECYPVPSPPRQPPQVKRWLFHAGMAQSSPRRAPVDSYSRAASKPRHNIDPTNDKG